MTVESTENKISHGEPPAPLAPGALLLDRYTIVEFVAANETANEYLVAATRACPFCGVENQGAARECGFCGNLLADPQLLRLTEQRAPSDPRQLPASSFVIDDYAYAFVNETTAAAHAPQLHWTFAAQSDTGLKRSAQGEHNEDCIATVVFAGQGAFAKTCGLFLLADGVGGATAGEVASRLALQILTREWTTRLLLPFWNGSDLTDEAIRAELRAGFTAANEGLLEYQTAHAIQSGATLTAVLILDTQAYVVNVGDSRTYLLRADAFAPVTRDHSYVGMLVANGILNPEEAYYHPQRNIILSSLGDAAATPDIFPLESGAIVLEAGDQFLLCSDGLWELVRDPEMQRVLTAAADAAAACATLVQLANAAGGADNISVIVIRNNTM